MRALHRNLQQVSALHHNMAINYRTIQQKSTSYR